MEWNMEIWKRREYGNMEWNIAAARCWTRREYGNEKAVAKRSGRGGARNVQYHWRRENAWADNSRGQRYETQRRKRRWANACAGLSSRAKNMEKQSSTRRPREFDLRTWPCPTRNAMRARRAVDLQVSAKTSRRPLVLHIMTTVADIYLLCYLFPLQ